VAVRGDEWVVNQFGGVASGALRNVGWLMGSHEAVLAEIAGALGILGLLLVFLPLYVQRVEAARSETKSQSAQRRLKKAAWIAPVLIAVASADATLGLFTIWGKWNAAGITGWLLLILVWLIVLLAAGTVWQGVK
jgi:hypothetical protein